MLIRKMIKEKKDNKNDLEYIKHLEKARCESFKLAKKYLSKQKEAINNNDIDAFKKYAELTIEYLGLVSHYDLYIEDALSTIKNS